VVAVGLWAAGGVSSAQTYLHSVARNTALNAAQKDSRDRGLGVLHAAHKETRGRNWGGRSGIAYTYLVRENPRNAHKHLASEGAFTRPLQLALTLNAPMPLFALSPRYQKLLLQRGLLWSVSEKLCMRMGTGYPYFLSLGLDFNTA